MSRRQFDDYDAREWEEDHQRVSKERRKREAKQQRHQTDDEDTSASDRSRPHRQPH